MRPGRISLGLVFTHRNHLIKKNISLLKSDMNTTPPFLKTRHISLNVALGSLHSWSDPLVKAASKVSSAKGILLPLLWTYSTLSDKQYSEALRFATEIISALISSPLSTVSPVCFNHSSPKYPGPGPISSTRP